MLQWGRGIGGRGGGVDTVILLMHLCRGLGGLGVLRPCEPTTGDVRGSHKRHNHIRTKKHRKVFFFPGEGGGGFRCGKKAGNRGREGLPQLPGLRSPQRARKYFSNLFFFFFSPTQFYYSAQMRGWRYPGRGSEREPSCWGTDPTPLFFFPVPLSLSFSLSRERSWVHRVEPRGTDLYTSGELFWSTRAITMILARCFTALGGASAACHDISAAVTASPANARLLLVKYRMCHSDSDKSRPKVVLLRPRLSRSHYVEIIWKNWM